MINAIKFATEEIEASDQYFDHTGSATHRLARRANALVLLDDGMSCEAIAEVLLLDDDTIRTWYRLYEEDGIEGPGYNSFRLPPTA